MARLTLCFDEDTIREIAALAAEQGMSKSAWLAQQVRTIIRVRAHHAAYRTEWRSAEDDQ